MYYYGNPGAYGGYSYGAGCGYGVPYTGGYGTGGAAIWIVLFILLVIIIGAGHFGGCERDRCCCERER